MVKMSTVWDRTAEFLTDNIGTLLPISLLAYFVPFSIRGNFAYASEGARFDFAMTLQLLSLGFAVLAVWGSLTIVAMVFEGGESRNAGTTAGKRLLPALGVAIAILLAFALVFAPIPLVIAAYGYDLESVFQGSSAAIPPFIGWLLGLYALAVLAFVFCAVARLIVVNPVIVAERRFLGAIPRALALTRGLTLPIVGVTFLYVILSAVAVLATQTVFGSIFQLIAGAPQSGVSLTQVLTSVMVAAVQTAFTVIAPVFTAKLYLALVAERGRAAVQA